MIRAGQHGGTQVTKRKLTAEIEFTGEDLFIIFDGKRIAKRGDDKTWIPLEPGYAVYSPSDHSTITIIQKPGLPTVN
jgi:hypothetical protein